MTSDSAVPDSPKVARTYCPGCEPTADETKELLDLRWCTPHTPSFAGADDEVIKVFPYLSGSTEAGDESNRAACALFHRDRDRQGGAAPTS